VSLVSPGDGTVLRLSRDIPSGDQALRIEALTSVPVSFVELYVDATPVGRAGGPPYRVNWRPAEGAYEIRARAVDAAGNEVWSPPAKVTVLPP
jgi:hypothetical protein